MMDKIEFKREVLAEAIKRHQSVIDDFKMGIEGELKAQSSNTEGGQDSGGKSKQAESILTRLNPLSEQLEFAKEELRLLNNMTLRHDELHKKVRPGSIVVTDKDTFFVSASIERFEVNGKKMFGLSTKAPLYKAMDGLKSGDTFRHAGLSYIIRDVF